MGVTVAEGVVVVKADVRDIGKDVETGLFGAIPGITRSGQKMGDGFADAFDMGAKDLAKNPLSKLRDDVANTARKLEDARDKEARAAGKVRIAEKELADARANYASDSAKVIRAEEKLEDANRQNRNAQRNTLEATKDNTRALNELGDASRVTADRLERDGDRAGRGWVDAFTGSFLGNALADVALGAARQIGDAITEGIRFAWDFAWDSIDIASGLNEADTALQAVFGEGAAAIDAFTKGASKSIGQSELDAKKASQTFGIYGKAAGLAADANAEFSSKLVTLASDLASFYDTSPEQAIEAIGAALRGESEPLRTYGVLLDDATLKARAMSEGLITTSVDMTKLEGAQLNVEKAQKKLNDAIRQHGEDSLEARDAANDLKKAQEDVGKIAEGSASGPLTQQQRVMAAYKEILAQTSVAAGDFSKTSNNLANQQRILAAQFEDAKGKLGTALLPVMSELVTYANDKFMPAFGDVIDKVGPELGDALIEAMPSLMEFLDAFVDLLPQLTEIGTSALPVFVSALQILLPILQLMVDVENGAIQATQGLFGLLSGDSTLSEFGQKLVDTSGFVGDLNKWLLDIINTFGGVMFSIRPLAGGIDSARVSFGFFGAAAGNAARDVSVAVAWIGAEIGSIGQRVLNAMSGAASILYSSGRALIQGFINGIRDMLGPVAVAVDNVIGVARSFFPNSPAKRGPLSGSGWTKLKESGGAVIDQWAAGMRDRAPEVPFDLMGLAKPGRGPARATFAADAVAPGISAPAANAGETHFHLEQTITSDNPTLAARQSARVARQYLGI